MNELSVCKRACIEAGEVALEYFQKEFEIKHKGKIDLVTTADFACEKKIKEVISSEFPEHAFLGEEEGASGDSEYLWVIDPIDGTTNFSHGLDHFCHSIALVKEKELICGAVYSPIFKKMFFAEKNKGAFLNDKKISVSKTSKLIDSILVTGFPYDDDELGEKTLKSIDSFRGNCQGLRRFGAAALDFCLVAQGVCDGFFEYTLQPWDVAAGILIVNEAGGKVTKIDGSEADIYSDNFLVSNSLLHPSIKSHLGEKE